MRKIALAWASHTDEWKWTSNRPITYTLHHKRFRFPTLEECLTSKELRGLDGFVALRPLQQRPNTLAELADDRNYFRDDDLPRLLASLKAVLDEDIDMNDPHVIMRAWEARNTCYAAEGFRLLAEACPALEEIEWHIPKDWTLMHTRWVWKVFRDETGSVRLVSPRELTWTGCPTGDPPRMEILVGQELAHERWEKAMLEVHV